MEKLQVALKNIIQELFGLELTVEVSRPEEKFGDAATNIALQLASKVGQSPRAIAEQIVEHLKKQVPTEFQSVDIAGPGFINVKFSDQALLKTVKVAPLKKPTTYQDKVVVAEYSDPNPFKVLHAGHFYTSVIGFGLASLFEAAGAKVHRVNFGGDVGLHAGKTMWAIIKELGGENPEKLAEIPEESRAEWMAKCYVIGNNTYDDDEQARLKIVELNKKIYQLHADDERQTPFAQIYWTCRAWSYEYFDQFYAKIGTPFERYYPESECAELGLNTVKAHIKDGIYQKSDGAVVFSGEKFGLHTRVFINKEGLPTYEAKDVGLLMNKHRDYNFDISLVITGSEQEQYMKVVLKSVEQFAPKLANSSVHLTHGIVKLRGGTKMSSRKGNILRAMDVIDAACAASQKATGRVDEAIVIDAIKYTFLKNRICADDIIFDPDESVGMEGNSGPYIQYAHARAHSLLTKVISLAEPIDLTPGERSLARKICEYPDVVQKAVDDLTPHCICTYLYELAQVFNRFYEKSRVVGDEREAQRAYLVSVYAAVLKDGLGLLNISAPEHL